MNCKQIERENDRAIELQELRETPVYEWIKANRSELKDLFIEQNSNLYDSFAEFMGSKNEYDVHKDNFREDFIDENEDEFSIFCKKEYFRGL